VERLVGELRLGLLALGDVAGHGDDLARVAVCVGHRPGRRLDPAHTAVWAHDAPGDRRRRLAALDEPDLQVRDGGDVVWVDAPQVVHGAADHLLGLGAEQRLACR
jgi:hypothetical protein